MSGMGKCGQAGVLVEAVVSLGAHGGDAVSTHERTAGLSAHMRGCGGCVPNPVCVCVGGSSWGERLCAGMH